MTLLSRFHTRWSKCQVFFQDFEMFGQYIETFDHIYNTFRQYFNMLTKMSLILVERNFETKTSHSETGVRSVQ